MMPESEMELRESESMLSVGISISGVDRAPRSGKLETRVTSDIWISIVVQNHGVLIRTGMSEAVG